MKLSKQAVAIATTFTLAGILASAITTANAQAQPQPAQQPTDSVVAVVADAQGLPLVPPDQIPFFGTFWEVRSSLPCLTAPLPFPPIDTNTPVYAIGDPIIGGQFLVDATAGQVVSPEVQSSRRALRSMSTASIVQAQVEELQAFVAGVQARQAEAVLRANGLMDPLPLDNQDGGPLDPMGLDSYPAGALWLSISQITNGVAPIVIHGTVPDVLYEIWSKQTLTDTVWSYEGSVLGAADQDWTPTTVTVGTRTNSLFLRCRSWVSSNGSGIPDWWLLQYGLPLNTDPYSLCPSGDGWTILQAYQNGWNPNLFYTPPPPQNVTAVLDASGTSATITWSSGGGPVTNYSIFGGYFYDHLVSPTTFTVTDTFDSPPYDFVLDWPYVVRAYFVNGTFADSQPARFTAPRLNSGFAAVRGPGGQLYLAVASVPPGLASVRVSWDVWDGTLGRDILRSIDVNATNFVNGAAPLPLDQMTGYYPGGWFYAQCISTNGSGGSAPWVWPYPFEEGDLVSANPPTTRFANASSHLKENLKFLLCSATLHQPFSYGPGDAYWGGFFDSVWEPEAYFARPPSPASYEYYGFHTFSSNLNYSVMQELRPAQENYLWRNFAYDPADFDASGQWNNGVGYERDLPSFRWLFAPKYEFSCTNCDPLPLALSVTNHPYLYARWVPYQSAQQFADDLAEIGLGVNGTNICLGGGLRNAYGLPLASVLYNAESPGARRTLDAGGACDGWYTSADYFCKVQPPTLHTIDYYFASQTRYLSWELNGWPGYGTLAGPPPPLPGSPTFSITNTSPLLIAGFGQPITVSGWAKQTIGTAYGQNLIGAGGNQYAYLEQYFDQAYTIDVNGSPTTNSAGLLSPYGEFFPMQPGPAALVTVPDIESDQRGTGVVNVIRLQLDVNHDGTMDASFAGPDNTSQDRPLLMWVNNGHTEPGTGGNPDQDLSYSGPQTNNRPNYSYGAIRCPGNLENFARLWVWGVPALPAGQDYLVQLAWSEIDTGAPRLRLYWACETSGGTSYLTNTTVAAEQIAQYNLPIGEISPTNSLTLPTTWFTSSLPRCFLFEAGEVGSGQLTLTIKQGTNTIAQTSAWLDFHDIRDFYEQALVTNIVQYWPEMVQTNLTSGFEVLSHANASLGDARQLAVFVHGWRMTEFDWYSFSETMFKRLWWQGYQGRFGALRWPTRSSQTDTNILLGFIPEANFTYNRSEHIAFESGAGAAAYFNDLRSRYPAYTISVGAHSMGNIVMLEALKQLAQASQKPLNNYVLMQAAVPAHCYDTSVTNLPLFETEEQVVPTPDVYSGYAVGITNALRGSAVNFYNPDDFALKAWQLNEGFFLQSSNEFLTMKPNTFLGYSYNASTGVAQVTSNFWQSVVGVTNVQTRTVTDLLELMPFVARPRSLAVGAQAGVQGSINGGELDLQGQLGFTGNDYDHSGEFRRNIQTPQVQGFYTNLVIRMFP